VAKKEESSRENYKKYIKGKEELKFAVLQHPDEKKGKSIFDYVKSQISRRLWAKPYSSWKKGE
jgi:hypothetical protein